MDLIQDTRLSDNQTAVKIWRFLTEPLPSVQGEEQRFKSRWLAATLIILIPLAFLAALAPSFIRGQPALSDTDFLVSIAAIVFWVIPYLMSRRGYYEVATVILAVSASIVIVLETVFESPKFSDLHYLLIPILFLSVSLPNRMIIGLVIADVIALIAITLAFPDTPVDRALVDPLYFLVTGSGMVLLIAYYRDKTEHFRADKLQQTNTRLQSEIQERHKAEEQLQASLQEKEILLKEIHHRVKNNLQIISSLLSLQSSSIADHQVEQLFLESQHRIRSMALIHEQLYRSHDLSQIDLTEYIYGLVSYLQRSYQTNSAQVYVDIQARPDRICVDVDTAVPCGLIVNELVSNALKHAFPDSKKGLIRVELEENDTESCTIAVTDNGTGFPESFDYHNTDSLGLQLVTALTEQLNGELSIQRNQGARFEIHFPNPPTGLNNTHNGN